LRPEAERGALARSHRHFLAIARLRRRDERGDQLSCNRGHIVEVGPDWSEGRLTAASRVGPRRRAAANPRGMQGYAAGR